MAKLAPTSIKYIIHATIKAKGVVEKPDVIGAIFGQTEGLLGTDLDLRELQRTGRIGRIEVDVKSTGGNSEGEITIPSSLDSAETALIAAAVETIERVGPCTAEITLNNVEDVRTVKREYVMDRAKGILKSMMEKGMTDSNDASDKIKESVRTEEIGSYKGSTCGPALMDSEEIIVVEGRADVINLLRYGIKNTVAVGGTSIPDAIVELAKEKSVTLLVDGDRGGELIAREFKQKADIDFVAQAPQGKEVEELTQKELFKTIREKVPASQFPARRGTRAPTRERSGRYERKERPERGGRYERKERPGRYSRSDRDRPDRRRPMRDDREPRAPRPLRLKVAQKELFKKTLDELVGTRAACIFDDKGELLGKVPIAELPNTLETLEKPHTVIFDGKLDFKIGSAAKISGVRFLVCMDRETFYTPITVVTKKDLE